MKCLKRHRQLAKLGCSHAQVLLMLSGKSEAHRFHFLVATYNQTRISISMSHHIDVVAMEHIVKNNIPRV